MKLPDYLQQNNLSSADFARLIEVNERESVRRYINGTRRPAPKIMMKIIAVTGGKVRADDFFDLPVDETALAG